MTGSSHTMNFGRRASARAMPMRWRWPPLNSCGIAVDVLLVEPDPLEQVADRRLALPLVRHARARKSPSPTISPTLMRGLRLAYGSWNTTWMSRRAAFISRDDADRTATCPRS